MIGELVRTRAIDARRRSELLAKADGGVALDATERVEIAALETRDDAFTWLCTRWAPLNPLALGFGWDEEITHEAAPTLRARIREGGLVEMQGERMTLMQATRRVATAAGRGVALADWSGGGMRLGDVAGMEHPPRPQRQEKTVDTGGRERPGAIGDLFG